MKKSGLMLLLGTLMIASPAMASDRTQDVALDAVADKVTITPAQAVKAAKTQVNGRVKEICLKAYAGQPVYEVEFDNDQEVLVDARTGLVMERPRKTK
jgi:uncharacterized membrane protein YkoI